MGFYVILLPCEYAGRGSFSALTYPIWRLPSFFRRTFLGLVDTFTQLRKGQRGVTIMRGSLRGEFKRKVGVLSDLAPERAFAGVAQGATARRQDTLRRSILQPVEDDAAAFVETMLTAPTVAFLPLISKRGTQRMASRPSNKTSLAQDLAQPFDDIIEWRLDFPASPWRL